MHTSRLRTCIGRRHGLTLYRPSSRHACHTHQQHLMPLTYASCDEPSASFILASAVVLAPRLE